MQKEIAKDREEHGKKPLKEDNAELEQKEIKQSTADPDCGVFHKGEHKKVFAYTANVACNSHNYILGFEATVVTCTILWFFHFFMISSKENIKESKM